MRIEMSGTEDADNLLFQEFKQRRGEILGKEKKKRVKAVTTGSCLLKNWMKMVLE